MPRRDQRGPDKSYLCSRKALPVCDGGVFLEFCLLSGFAAFFILWRELCSRWSRWLKPDSPATEPLVFLCQPVATSQSPESGLPLGLSGLLWCLLPGPLPAILSPSPLVSGPHTSCSHPFEMCQFTLLLCLKPSLCRPLISSARSVLLSWFMRPYAILLSDFYLPNLISYHSLPHGSHTCPLPFCQHTTLGVFLDGRTSLSPLFPIFPQRPPSQGDVACSGNSMNDNE